MRWEGNMVIRASVGLKPRTFGFRAQHVNHKAIAFLKLASLQLAILCKSPDVYGIPATCTCKVYSKFGSLEGESPQGF